MTNQTKHVLYETKDADRPDVICDSNGEVALGLCRNCGLGEAELLDQPACQAAEPAFIQRMAQVALDACRDPAPAEPLVTFRKPQNRDEVIVLLRMASGLVTEINDQFGALLAQPAPATETDGELLARLGTDAMKWTEEFCKRTPSVYPDKMLGWFANAIEAGRSAGVRQHSVEYWRSIAVALGAPAE